MTSENKLVELGDY